MRRYLVAATMALALGACHDATTDVSGDGSGPQYNMSGAQQANPRYIVRFRDTEANASGETDRLVRAHGGRLAFRYRSAIKGFAGEFSARDIAALARDPNVVAIEKDQMAYATGTQPNPPSWGLDRIDQHPLPLNMSYSYGTTGAGVRVYILDTGILFTHNDFGGRASAGIDEITPGGSAVDCAGHGTHVAANVGGNTYGVAKGVTLFAVRVLDCGGSGSYAQVIAGVDWVTLQKQNNPSIPMVANMSLGGPPSPALDAAVTASINAGVTYAIAAGNDNLNACGQSPASTPTAITVGSTTITDARSSFSNFGNCVDIFAPGSSITSAWYTSNSATNTISGTSMATPHVAGAAALYLETNPSATPATVTTALKTNATSGVVTNPGTGSPNLLLYTGFITGGPPPVPVANFTFNCTGLNCSFDASGSTAQPNATYGWAWGDGTANGSGKTTTHGFAAAGTYSVVLTVNDAGGSDTRTQAVTVAVPPPNQAPVAVVVLSCSAYTCSFDGRGSTDDVGIVSYEWFGGELVSTLPFFTRTFNGPRNMTWRLVVRDAGGLTDTRFFTIIAPASPPVANYSFSCTNLNCSFDAGTSTAQPAATYTWAWGDGSANGAGKTTTHSFAAGGTFNVTLTVSDPGGTGNRTQAVTVSPVPSAPVANYTFSCTFLNCSFDASSSTAQPNATYGWAWGDGTPGGSGKTAAHSFGAGGSYAVVLTVTDAGGSNGRTQTVTVTPPPPVPVANYTFTCTNLACSFDASGSTAQPNATYGWAWGDGTPNGSGKTPTHSFAAGGTYSVVLTVTDAGGSNSRTQAVTVTPPPPPPPVANYTFSCTNLNCSFDAGSSTAQPSATYGWAWGDGTANGSGKTATHSFVAGGTYNVALTVTDAGGSDSRTQAVTVTAPVGNQPPVAVVVLTCVGRTCTFDGRNSTDDVGIVSYAWFGGELVSTLPVFTRTFDGPRNMTWTLTVRDAGGLSNTKAFLIQVP